MNTIYQKCIEACQQCLVDCQYCLFEMAGKKSMNDCPKCCAECVDACLMSIKMMAADSKHASQYCLLCALICEWCAEQCGAHEHEHCQICAESCKKCAEECRKIAA